MVERAKDLKNTPVVIASAVQGIGEDQQMMKSYYRDSITDIPEMGLCARQLYADSKLGPDDIHASAADGTPGAFVSCEGGDFLDGGLDGLGHVHARGVRSITLVHYRVNELGDIQTEAPRHGGLTSFGKEVVAAMNSLGMIVDLAHATFDATVDALEVSSAPILISHSHLARPGADHPRLLSEEHARMVADVSAGDVVLRVESLAGEVRDTSDAGSGISDDPAAAAVCVDASQTRKHGAAIR